MEVPTEKYICWSDACIWHPIGGSLTILRVTKGEPGLIPTEEKSPGVRLNEVGKDIWDLCDGTRSFDDIVGQLLEEYEGEPEEIREGIQKVISDLKEKDFITFEDEIKDYDVVEVPPGKYLAWDDNVLWNEMEGQVIAMNNETGMSLEFPKELGEVWKLCDGTRSAREIISVLKEKGTVTEGELSGGFYLLFKQLVKLQMITVADKPVQ
jgi:hypothetical protein